MHGHLLMAADLAAASGALTGDAEARAVAATRHAGRAAGLRVPVRCGVGAGAAAHVRIRGGAELGCRARYCCSQGRDQPQRRGGSAGKTMAWADHEFD
ncbi:hypothetical protein GQ55_9G335100 [Panicum hallii var. hallii]|uniref:Uncharacterized protein n=1 Tax=Panicum hallii var. hallii TaxID=1504633 RepID=A0A2T7C8E7_9POAL|nr:hypothetical protein GQ55_9G335100 [Panicum hallii var. hallii]